MILRHPPDRRCPEHIAKEAFRMQPHSQASFQYGDHISKGESRHPVEEALFLCMYRGSQTFSHYPLLVAIVDIKNADAFVVGSLFI